MLKFIIFCVFVTFLNCRINQNINNDYSDITVDIVGFKHYTISDTSILDSSIIIAPFKIIKQTNIITDSNFLYSDSLIKKNDYFWFPNDFSSMKISNNKKSIKYFDNDFNVLTNEDSLFLINKQEDNTSAFFTKYFFFLKDSIGYYQDIEIVISNHSYRMILGKFARIDSILEERKLFYPKSNDSTIAAVPSNLKDTINFYYFTMRLKNDI